jgi:hypothetical protein
MRFDGGILMDKDGNLGLVARSTTVKPKVSFLLQLSYK